MSAPADGYFCYKNDVNNAQGSFVSFVEPSYGGRIMTSSYFYSHGGCVVPVLKNQSIAIYYKTNVINNLLRFVYAVGSEPMA